MREIGSEFWDVPQKKEKTKTQFPTVQWYLSGRSALRAIIRDLKDVKTIAFPSWCCDSMVRPFFEAGIAVVYYSVLFQNGFIQTIDLNQDALFLMDYFGYSTQIEALHPCTIRDVTHSVFTGEYKDADYFFGSLRKWCGIWTGGYAWAKDGRKLMDGSGSDNGFGETRKKAMKLKAAYIRTGEGVKGDFLRLFEEAEKCLETAGIAPAAERDISLAAYLDDELVRKKRRQNAKILMDAMPEQLIFRELNEKDCPMFVPILVPDGNRDKLKRYLIEHDIYCPTHWPISKYHALDSQERKLYDNELSLVCDQRYDAEDMYRIIETIKGFWREGKK